ncbi:sacsin N-terminal ATP-binding-like domain-containing protein [Tepidibacter sp. Z1-5]|uniref:sacsin N-terminal ATP-binding-like domain-containing protein n=1 Tax=Tepidibacter sp. Z1-5 TaxID=3134138 RepID=UPI0030BF2EBF
MCNFDDFLNFYMLNEEVEGVKDSIINANRDLSIIVDGINKSENLKSKVLKDFATIRRKNNQIKAYSDRFIFEIIQNADDAMYNKGKKLDDKLDIKIKNNNDTFSIELNYKGTPFDVKSIIGILVLNKSTKDGVDTTGKYGIGLKSVYNLANGFTISNSGIEIKTDKTNNSEPYKISLVKFEDEKQTSMNVILSKSNNKKFVDSFNNIEHLFEPLQFFDKNMLLFTKAIKTINLNINGMEKTINIDNNKYYEIINTNIYKIYYPKKLLFQDNKKCYMYSTFPLEDKILIDESLGLLDGAIIDTKYSSRTRDSVAPNQKNYDAIFKGVIEEIDKSIKNNLSKKIYQEDFSEFFYTYYDNLKYLYSENYVSFTPWIERNDIIIFYIDKNDLNIKEYFNTIEKLIKTKISNKTIVLLYEKLVYYIDAENKLYSCENNKLDYLNDIIKNHIKNMDEDIYRYGSIYNLKNYIKKEFEKFSVVDVLSKNFDDSKITDIFRWAGAEIKQCNDNNRKLEALFKLREKYKINKNVDEYYNALKKLKIIINNDETKEFKQLLKRFLESKLDETTIYMFDSYSNVNDSYYYYFVDKDNRTIYYNSDILYKNLKELCNLLNIKLKKSRSDRDKTKYQKYQQNQSEYPYNINSYDVFWIDLYGLEGCTNKYDNKRKAIAFERVRFNSFEEFSRIEDEDSKLNFFTNRYVNRFLELLIDCNNFENIDILYYIAENTKKFKQFCNSKIHILKNLNIDKYRSENILFNTLCNFVQDQKNINVIPLEIDYKGGSGNPKCGGYIKKIDDKWELTWISSDKNRIKFRLDEFNGKKNCRYVIFPKSTGFKAHELVEEAYDNTFYRFFEVYYNQPQKEVNETHLGYDLNIANKFNEQIATELIKEILLFSPSPTEDLLELLFFGNIKGIDGYNRVCPNCGRKIVEKSSMDLYKKGEVLVPLCEDCYKLKDFDVNLSETNKLLNVLLNGFYR